MVHRNKNRTHLMGKTIRQTMGSEAVKSCIATGYMASEAVEGGLERKSIDSS